MLHGTLVDENGRVFDDALILSFVAPHSFTGEDVIEFHSHGSVAIVEKLFSLLSSQVARPARRGEFSYRAYLNGRIGHDRLVQLGDVFQARSVPDLMCILNRNDSIVQNRIDHLKGAMMGLQAILDTAIDFSEEYPSVISSSLEPVSVIIRECSALISRYDRLNTETVSRKIGLFGRPNAGKSSLFNALLGRYRAIVHDSPGTTRDLIEQEIVIEGRRWHLLDSAGIRSGAGTEAEALGVSLARDAMNTVDVGLLVVDGADPSSPLDECFLDAFSHRHHLVVATKSDRLEWRRPKHMDAIKVSAVTGEGLDALWSELSVICDRYVGVEEEPLPTGIQACRLRAVLEQVSRLKVDMENNVPAEYLAEQGRKCLSLLDVVTGDTSQEDILGMIFSQFCIGK